MFEIDLAAGDIRSREGAGIGIVNITQGQPVPVLQDQSVGSAIDDALGLAHIAGERVHGDAIIIIEVHVVVHGRKAAGAKHGKRKQGEQDEHGDAHPDHGFGQGEPGFALMRELNKHNPAFQSAKCRR